MVDSNNNSSRFSETGTGKSTLGSSFSPSGHYLTYGEWGGSPLWVLDTTTRTVLKVSNESHPVTRVSNSGHVLFRGGPDALRNGQIYRVSLPK